MRDNIDEQENIAKSACWKEVEKECRLHYQTKEGKRNIKDLAKKVLDEHDLKRRLNRKKRQTEEQEANGDQDKMTRTESETMVKKQHTLEAYKLKVERIIVSRA